MPRQSGLPGALARRGLKVELGPGWDSLGSSSFFPGAGLCHWTAGPRTGDRPSLRICTYGRSDLSGPLCNVFLTRAGVAVVVASGRANHAGVGGWRGMRGNSAVFGTEAESSGPDDWTDAQRAAYPKINAAYCDLGGFGAEMIAGHSEYAEPRGRKIDINGYPMDEMRAATAAVLAGSTGPETVLEDEMNQVQEQLLKDIHAALPMIRAVHHEMLNRFASRGDSPPTQDTLVGHVLNIDATLRNTLPSVVSGSKARLTPLQFLQMADAYGFTSAQRIAALQVAVEALSVEGGSSDLTPEVMKQIITDAVTASVSAKYDAVLTPKNDA